MEPSAEGHEQIIQSSHSADIVEDDEISSPHIDKFTGQNAFSDDDAEFDKTSGISATSSQRKISPTLLKIIDDTKGVTEPFFESDGEKELPEYEFFEELGYDSDIEVTLRKSIGKSLTSLEKKDQKKKLSAVEQRLNIISQLKEVWEERKTLKLKNGFLHKKCKDFLSKYKIMSYFEKPTGVSIYSDKRYEEILDTFRATQSDTVSVERYCSDELEELEFSYENHRILFDELHQSFATRLLEIAAECSGEKYASKKIQMPLLKHEKRLREVTTIRVEYFKLQHLLSRIDEKNDALNDFGEGRTIINYTNLLATKNRLAERLDEREEELGKIRKKCFNFAPILSHMRQTSSGLAREIKRLSAERKKVDETNQRCRMCVVNKGRKRDLLRQEYFKLYQSAFLLVHPKLMKALLNSSEELKTLKSEIEQLKLLLKHQ